MNLRRFTMNINEILYGPRNILLYKRVRSYANYAGGYKMQAHLSLYYYVSLHPGGTL